MKAAGWSFGELIPGPGAAVPRYHGHPCHVADPGAYGQITEYGGQIASSSTEITCVFFDVAAFQHRFWIHLPSTELTYPTLGNGERFSEVPGMGYVSPGGYMFTVIVLLVDCLQGWLPDVFSESRPCLSTVF